MFLHRTVEGKKQYYIDQLLNAGIYKIRDMQLYELSLSELRVEFVHHVK